MKCFNDGAVYAAARLIEIFDQPTMAMAIINEAGLTHEDLKKCNEYDLAFLRKEDPAIPAGIE